MYIFCTKSVFSNNILENTHNKKVVTRVNYFDMKENKNTGAYVNPFTNRLSPWTHMGTTATITNVFQQGGVETGSGGEKNYYSNWAIWLGAGEIGHS